MFDRGCAMPISQDRFVSMGSVWWPTLREVYIQVGGVGARDRCGPPLAGLTTRPTSHGNLAPLSISPPRRCDLPLASVPRQGHLDVVDIGPALSHLSTLTLLDLYHPHQESPFVVSDV